MSDIPESLLVVGESFEQKYQPVLDFSGWRVAMLRAPNGVDPTHVQQVERHRETNEVFILTAGQADLILFDGDQQPTGAAFVFPMRLNVAYDIQQAVWHQVAMSPDAHIIIFERTDTTVANSNYAQLSPETIRDIQSRLTVKPA